MDGSLREMVERSKSSSIAMSICGVCSIKYRVAIRLSELPKFASEIAVSISENRPDPLNTGNLYKFPYENDEYHYLAGKPYVEVAVGIENIFRVLRVDYVRRITYTDLPGIDKNGIRIQFHIQF